MNPNQPYRSNGRNYGNQRPYSPANAQASRASYASSAPQATAPAFAPQTSYRPSGPLPFTPNPNLPPMPEASRVPANSLLPFEAQSRQAEQLARRPQPPAYAPAPVAAPAPAVRPPAPEPMEPAAPLAPTAPVAAEAVLRPELGEHRQPAAAKDKPADPPPPAAAKATLVVEDEGDDDNFGNRIGHAPVPTARASAGRGRQQTRAMQSDHQRLGQSATGRPVRGARASDTASASQGDAQATSLLRQASLQKPAVQGHAADLRPRREGRSPSPRPGYGRQW
jgi:hypothetical protein